MHIFCSTCGSGVRRCRLPSHPGLNGSQSSPNGVKKQLKKRRTPDADPAANRAEKPTQPFIGPLLPSPYDIEARATSIASARSPGRYSKEEDRGCIKASAQAIKRASMSLAQYADEDDDAEDTGWRKSSRLPLYRTKAPPALRRHCHHHLCHRYRPKHSMAAPHRCKAQAKDTRPYDDDSSAHLSSPRRTKTLGSVTAHRPFGFANPFSRTSSVKKSMRGRHLKRKTY